MLDPPHLKFVTASGIVTVLDRTAPDHHYTRELWRFAIDTRATLVTTDYSVLVAALALQQRHGLEGVEQLFHGIVPALRVEGCAGADLEVAVASLLASADTDRDLVSHVEDRIRQRLRVKSAITGDPGTIHGLPVS